MDESLTNKMQSDTAHKNTLLKLQVDPYDEDEVTILI